MFSPDTNPNQIPEHMHTSVIFLATLSENDEKVNYITVWSKEIKQYWV